MLIPVSTSIGWSFRATLLMALTLLAAASVGWLIAPRLGALTIMIAVAGIAGLVILARPMLGLCLMALTIPIENLFVLEGVTWTRAIGAVTVAAWGLHLFVNPNLLTRMLGNRVIPATLLFAAFASLSLLWAQHLPSSIEQLVTLVSLLVLSLLVFSLVISWNQLDWLLRSLLVGGLIASILTISQFFLMGFHRAGDDISGGVNQTGTVLVATLPLAFYLAFVDKSRFWRLAGLAYIALASIAVALTVSRLSLLILPIILGTQVWLLLRKRYIHPSYLFAIGAVIAFSVYFVVPWEYVIARGSTVTNFVTRFTEDNPQQSESRVQHWLGAIAIGNDHPLQGIGYGNFGSGFLSYQFAVSGGDGTVFHSFRSPHSTILGIYAELGIVGAVLWLSVILMAFVNLLAARAHLVKEGRGRQEFLIQAVFFSLFTYSLYSLPSLVHNHKLLWLLIGLTAVINQLTTTTPGDTSIKSKSR